MKPCDHMIHAKWIITSEDQNAVLENHTLIVDNDKITAILKSHDAKEQYIPSHTHYYGTHAVLPGFINTHTHIPMNFFRGLADDLSLMNWLNHHIWPAEKKWLSEELVYDASLFAMAEMIRSGTTCFNDMFFFMPQTAKATEVAGLRGHIALHVISFESKWAKNFDDEIAKGLAFYEEYKNSPFVKVTIAAHSQYTVTQDEHLLKIKDIAEQYDFQINMHVQEPKSEIDTVMGQTKMRPLERLEKLGLMTPRLIAIHMLHLNAEDFAILEKGKPNIVHCPESNMKLASGICPTDELLARGINVALGTDSAASNNDLNMLGEMRSAALLAKHHSGNPESLSAVQTLKMATLNGAKALKIDDITGSLTIGKSADFIAINLEEIETLPVYHPVSQIVYATSRHQVTDVWVKGKQLLKNRELTTLDEKELFAKAHAWGKKIKGG